MKFDPKLPDASVNVSRARPAREAAILVGGILALGAVLLLAMALALDLIVPRIPARYEIALVDATRPDGSDQQLDDPADPAIAELSALLERLASHWPENPYPLQVRIAENESTNAFALPGGRIVVTAGLLRSVASENELAFVLGHELGHFRNRDHLRGIGRALALALLLEAFGLEGDAAGELAEFGGQLATRSFDRDQESDADRFGLTLVQAEYGHVAGSGEFFRRMAGGDDAAQSGWELSDYLSTHPGDAARVDALAAFARDRGWHRKGRLRPVPPALAAPEAGE